ncbi:MAG: S8 family serine peptidase [Candidatus Eisenbacteria bacterium]|nr:S8 family serine peptidase [Candidatus Eisenbacteria bacterium]
MKHLSTLATAAALLIACSGPAAGARSVEPPAERLPVVEPLPAGAPNGPRWASDGVLVRFRAGLRPAARAAALAVANASVAEEYPRSGVTRLHLAGTSVEQAVAALSADPRIAWAEPDWVLWADRVPDDTRYPDQWSLANRGQGGGIPGADIRAEFAWDFTTGDSSVVVGVIDTGVDLAHPDLAGNLWTNPGEIPGNGVDDEGDGYVDDVHGWDFANQDADPQDDNGHGTHVAGTIAAVGDNALGIAGVCWRTKVMALKFLSAGGSGLTSNAVAALEYAMAHGVRITNNSWGGGPRSQALADALAAAGAGGMLIVVAAGNSAVDVDATAVYPPSYDVPEMITVAATDKNDSLAGFSNWGATTVDLAAPGDRILSLWPARRLAILSGTSMAAPHVSGAAALLLAREPGLPAAAMKARLMRGAVPLASLAGRCVSGARLDLLRAVADPDTVAPGAPEQLRVTGAGSDWLDLAWTATGDDGDGGTAYRYDLRTAARPFGPAGFDSALRVFVGAPRAAGSPESVRLHGLAPLTTYWLAVRAEDEFGNAGPLSEVVSGTTLEPPRLALAAPPLTAALRTGERLDRDLILTNASQGTLDWRVRQPALGPMTGAPPSAGGVADAAGPVTPAAKGARSLPRPARTDSAGGPDAFGYRWLDSREPGGPGFAWLDIARPANQLDLTGDDAVRDGIPIGFAFPFYGDTFTTVSVCTNGFLSFEPAEAAYANTGLPSVLAPGRLVAPLWDDLSFGFGARRTYAWSDGARFVVSWVAAPRYADPLTSLTFQVILEPGGEIRCQYLRLTGDVTSCTVGIQDASRSTGLQVAANQPYLRDSLALRIVPLPRWVAAGPDSGTLGPGGSTVVRVSFDATRLGDAALLSALHVLTNDPLAPDTLLPVSLQVTGVPLARLHTSALDFGAVQAGREDTLALLLENAGGVPLPLAAFEAPAPFAALATPHSLEPGAYEALPVRFAPPAPGASAGILVLTTGDPQRPRIEVPLAGLAIPPPAIAVPADELRFLAANDAGALARERRAAVLVRNTGLSPLHWSATASQAAAPPPASRAVRGPAIKGAAEPAGALGGGGPDAAGYRWSDSDSPGGLPFEWEEISESGSRLFGGADDSTRTGVPLPFAFPFYGDTFTTVNVCTNGWLSFTGEGTAFLNGDLPDTSAATPRALIAPWWDDLDLRPVGGLPAAFAWYDGEKFVIEWRDVAHFAIGGPYTFEVMLWPDGAMDLQYLSMSGATDQATIGLQDGTGAAGLRIAWNTPYVHDRLRVRIARRAPWLALERATGVTVPGGTDTLWVLARAEGWQNGELAGQVRIASDDPGTPLAILPVSLHIGAVRAAATMTPARLGPVSLAPRVRLEVALPAGHSGLLAPTVTLAGVPARTDSGGGPPAGTGVAWFDAIALRAALPAGGDSVALPFAGETREGWVVDTVHAAVERATLAATGLAPFGTPAAVEPVRTGTPVLLEWQAPEAAERVDVLHSADGGRAWKRLASVREPSWTLVPAESSQANLIELVAMRADTAIASWLSAPFAVTGPEAPRLLPALPPRAFALRLLGSRPGRLPARLLLSLPETGQARVTVHDLRGARVRTLVSGRLEAGEHLLEWDGRAGGAGAVPPGVYFLRAEAGGHGITARVVLLR